MDDKTLKQIKQLVEESLKNNCKHEWEEKEAFIEKCVLWKGSKNFSYEDKYKHYVLKCKKCGDLKTKCVIVG